MVPDPIPEGGTNQRDDEYRLSSDPGPTWLAAFAGALLGATLCSSFASTLFGPSFGVSGAVFGVLMGAIYGTDLASSL